MSEDISPHDQTDCRIWTNNTIEPEFWYPVSLEFLNDLWIPNVFIYNLKSFQNIAVLKRLAGQCSNDYNGQRNFSDKGITRVHQF